MTDGHVGPAPATEPSEFDRLEMPRRDTPRRLGTEIPRCDCAAKTRQLLAFEERDAIQRDYIARLAADLGAAERRITAYRTRFGEVAG